MDIATKSTGDSMTAAEQNQVTNEVENVIGNTGQTPSSGDLFQLSKGISDYAAHGDTYTDSGSASTYVLAAQGSKQAPTAYVNGFRAKFVVGNTNTGASTVNIATLGVKSIKRVDGSALVAGDMTSGDTVIISYDGTDFLLLYSTADKTKIDEGLSFDINSAEAGAKTITSSLVSMITLDLGTVVTGDVFQVDTSFNATKGATAGIMKVETKLTGGSTAVIAIYNSGTSIVKEEDVGIGIGVFWPTSAIVRVTTGGTMVLDVLARSAGSDSSSPSGGIQVQSYALRKQ